MSKQFNPKMLEVARVSRGYTQKDLAALLPNLNQGNLSKIEKGELNVTEDTLENVSKTLGYPKDFFYQSELKTPPSNIYYRKRATMPQKALNALYCEITVILKAIEAACEEVELDEYPRFIFDLSQGWTPDAVAQRMREILKMPDGPIKTPMKFLEDVGIVIYLLDTKEEKFDGLTAYTDNGIPVLFVNKNFSNDRLKFTLMHELGHLIMHIPCDVEPWRDVELEANQFASEIFMPAKDCTFELKGLNYNKLSSLKAYWGISKAAIIHKAKQVGAIETSTYTYLMIELGRRKERKNETGYVAIDEPSTIKQIISLLKTELHYSNDEIALRMKLTIEDFSKYFLKMPNENGKIRLMKYYI